MSLLANIIGGSAFGFGVRCFQLGLQKRGIFEFPTTHLAYMGAFGLVGYGFYEGEKRQQVMLDERRKSLQEKRDLENAAVSQNPS